jgi:hypothetical protein
MAKIVKQKEEEKQELLRLREKFKIVCEEQNELTFKDLMIVKTRQPCFFYEYKKNRTKLLKSKEPPSLNHFIRNTSGRKLKRKEGRNAKSRRF